MNEETVKIGVVLTVLIVLLSGLVLVASGRLRNAFVINLADPDTVGIDICGFNTFGLRGFGTFPDLAGDTRGRGEIFDRTVVFYSWFKDGRSMPIVGDAKVSRCPGISTANYPNRMRFMFSINNGAGFKPLYQDKIPQGFIEYVVDPGISPGDLVSPAFSIDLAGFAFCNVPIPSGGGCPSGQEETVNDGAALKVNFQIKSVTFPVAYDYADVASDQVGLLSAVPVVSWSRDGYTVGDTATVRYTIPVAKDSNGNPLYFLSVLDQNTNMAIPGYDRLPLTATAGSVSFVVTPSMFSNNLQTCQNRLRAQILSTLIVSSQQDASVAQTVDIGGPAPTVTYVSWDKPKYFEGDTAAVSWTATGNISKYHVTVLINGLSLVDVDVPSSQTSYTGVRLPRSGTAQAEVTAYSLCQPSVVKRAFATVGNFYPGLCTVYPNLKECGPVSNLIPYILVALAILGIIATLGLLLFLLGKIELIPGWISILIAVLVAGGLAAYFISAGTFDILIRGG